VQQFRAEQRAARVGVDFDQARPVVAQVEVVTHEDAGRARDVAGDGRRVGQHAVLPGRQRNDTLDGADEVGHEVEMRLGDIDLRVREQMWVRGTKRLVRHAAGFERTLQAARIDRAADAALVEQRGGRAAIGGQIFAAHRRRHGRGHGYSASPKKSRTTLSSRVRFIGGRLRQTRLP